MAKILRGLDMLAGEAGRVMYGENARKEQLLAGVAKKPAGLFTGAETTAPRKYARCKNV